MEGTSEFAEPAVLRDLMYRGPGFRTGEGGGRADSRDGSDEVRDVRDDAEGVDDFVSMFRERLSMRDG